MESNSSSNKYWKVLLECKKCLPLKCPIKFFDLSCMLSLDFEEGSCQGTGNVRKNVYVILHIISSTTSYIKMNRIELNRILHQNYNFFRNCLQVSNKEM